jgi:hypothetical protein
VLEADATLLLGIYPRQQFHACTVPHQMLEKILPGFEILSSSPFLVVLLTELKIRKKNLAQFTFYEGE